MKKVVYKKFIPHQYEDMGSGNKKLITGTGVYEEDFNTEGEFLGWGTEHEELNRGVGQYTIAIIKTQEGFVEGVHISNLKFVD